MTREDIIRMAREAWPAGEIYFDDQLVRFAYNIEQHLIQIGYRRCAEEIGRAHV